MCSRIFILSLILSIASPQVLADLRELSEENIKRAGRWAYQDPPKAQKEELINLVRADEYEKIGLEEKEFRGRIFSFERNRFVLSDGTEVIWSVGRQK